MDLKEIKTFIDLMKKNSISEFELENQGFKIKLKRGGGGTVGSGFSQSFDDNAAPVSSQANQQGISSSVPQIPNTGANIGSDLEIKSPMIGTFYRAPSPESGNYVEIGSEVGGESVVCIIEAMKVMNEIKAELKGVITQVLVENGKPVEFGQPLFKIRPS